MTQKYRLEGLLRVKEKNRKRAEMALAVAIRTLKEEEEKLKKLEGEKETILKREKEARRKMDAEVRGGSSVGKGSFHVNFIRKLKEDGEKKCEEIEEQELEIEQAKQKVSQSKRDYIDAAKEHKTMEKHKDLWLKKLKKEITKREEKEMDELGQTIHSLRRWRKEESLFEA